MTAKTRKNLEALKKSIKENTPRIERKLARAGVKADPALVHSAAMYYPTLKKLAKE